MTLPKSGALMGVIACAIVLAAGCARHKPPIPPAPSPVIVIFDVVGAKPLRVTRFDVAALDRPGRTHAAITSASIRLSMPTMSMPPNVVSLKAVSPGHFSGIGTFPMAGRWNATVHLAMQDGTAIDQDFPVSL